MKRSKIIVLNKAGFINFFKRNQILILILSIFIIGLILGVILIDKSKTTLSLSEYLFSNYIKTHCNQKFILIFLKSFISFFSYIFLIYLSGTSLIGVIISPFLVGACGYLSGAFISNLYNNYSLKGIAFNATNIIPSLVFFLLALILCARESLNFSYELSKLTLTRKYAYANIFDYFKNYCGRYLVLSLLLILSSLIDATLSKVFLHYFNF